MSEININGKKSKKKKFCTKKRKNKLAIVFDENARREFLTGFRKRKLERKNKAKEEFEKQLKAEKKRIKAEAKEQYRKLLLLQKPIPELSDLMSENLDMGTHFVSVTEFSAADLAKKNNWIGINEVQYYEGKNDEKYSRTKSKLKIDKLEGMELKSKNQDKHKDDGIFATSYKEIKKKIKQQAVNNVKNSKVFQKKAKLEKLKNLKIKKKQLKKLEKLKRKQKK